MKYRSPSEGLESIPAIEVDHVCLSYDSHRALDNVSFAIPEGSYVGIIGPNGGGKTTMLRVLLGLKVPQEGQVRIFGQSSRMARKNGAIGYVPQKIAQSDFSFPATVAEIVWSGRTPRIPFATFATKKDRTAVQKAMRMTNVTHLQSRLIGKLSGGERQRVFIARALAAEPKLLILDEPTTGVDVASRNQFYALLKQLNVEHRLTILIVSHDIEMVTDEVSFVLALNQKLICHCASHDFLSDKTLKKLYGRDVETAHAHSHA